MRHRLGGLKPYPTPRKGDVVVHLDEPEHAHCGTVVRVGEETFDVLWYDGQTEDYENDDHPEICQFEER